MKEAKTLSLKSKVEAAKAWFSLKCPCGSKGGQYLSHYGIVCCACGKFYWALQPHRGGPLKLFPHPGFHAAT